MQKEIAVIGAALGWGARWPETELGPDTVREAGILKQLKLPNMLTIQTEISACLGERRGYSEKLQLIYDFSHRLAQETERVSQAKKCPLVIGGDHAIAIGTWQGIKAGSRSEQFGLLWVDAHLDSHTPETSLSHNIHGMPLAVLLGYGESALTHLKSKSPTLLPQHVALLGVRSADPGETELIQSLGVRVFTMNEIMDRGLSEVMAEAKDIVTQETDAFGMSIDVDAFDPSFAPGTGCPEPNGLDPNELLPYLQNFSSHPHFCGLEIAEFNPTKDEHDKTLSLIRDLASILV
ncbi:MAG: arginase [Gammaproteobacteria bacterium]